MRLLDRLFRRRRGAAPSTEAAMRAALDLAAVFLRDPDGTIRYWSRGAERLFGYPAEAAIGRRAHELLRTRFMEGGRRAAEAELASSGRWHGELRHRRRDGSLVTVAASWELRTDATGPQVVEASTEATALKAAEQELRASEGRLRLAQEVAGIGTWEWLPDGDQQEWSREQHALFGTDPDAETQPTTETLLARVHPEDRATLRAAIAHGLDSGEYEAEFRIRRRGRDGLEETRWLLGRGRRMPGRAGRPGTMLGVHVDITARKDAETRQTLLIREVDHRAKNALAVVQAVLRLTRAPDQASYVRAVEGRVAALARAQTLLTQSRWSGADLRALLEGELAPFLAGGRSGPAVTFDGPPLMLAPVVAQPLSMAVHELATNAVKHGALRAAGGHVLVRWDRLADHPPRLVLDWIEHGATPLGGAPPGRQGFGIRVLKGTVEEQLGGRLEQRWGEHGLACRIEIPLPEPAPAAALPQGAWETAREEAACR
jgi:PAS domain S-box-containing protein